jgi:cytochrome c biogenesis protein CcdA
MTETEMILYDLGLFLWFVLTLTASHALAARVNERPRYAAAALLAGPLLQVGWVLIVIALIESGAYA